MVRNRVFSYVLMSLAALVCAGPAQAAERVDASTNPGAVWKQAGADNGLLEAFHGAAGAARAVAEESELRTSLDGDMAVIGVWEAHNRQGAAYVFVRRNGIWSQEAELTVPDGVAGGRFGSAVSLSGDTAVIGAPGEAGGRGAVYVFVRGNGTWDLQQKLVPSDGVAWDGFGSSVSVSGDRTVAGAPARNGLRGAAYVFVRRNGAWGQQQELAASGGAAGDLFGVSTSVTGDTMLIGAANRNGYRGAAYVFVRGGGVWSQKQELAASDGAAGDFFGISTAVNGDTAVIGAAGKDGGRGAAYLFVSSSGTWSQRQELTAADGAANDRFGATVSLGRNQAVIGAPRRNGGRGAAYVFAQPAILGTTSLLLGSAGGTSSVMVSCSCTWTATSNASFLHISPGSASGTGNGLVVFTYDAFTGTGTQTGTLTIAGLTVTVTQAGTNFPLTGGAALVVSLGSNPWGVAMDGSGNVYIANAGNNTIQEWILATQQLTTLVSGVGYAEDVALDSSGNVYIADWADGEILEWIAATQQVTTLVSGLSYPVAVAVDSYGNVYWAAGNIAEWNAATQQVTTLVSTGINQPQGVAVDVQGNVYIADWGNWAIEEWNAATQEVTTLVSTGLVFPTGVAVDGSGNVYISDGDQNAITEWSAATQQVSTLVSTGLNAPERIVVDGSGNAFFADMMNFAIKEIPNVFMGPASLNEPISAGSDSFQVIPATANLTGVFAPTSNQAWLTIGTPANGVVPFSFSANTGVARVGQINVLGQQITVNQLGLPPQTITFGPLPTQALGSGPITVSATASSGLPVSFNSETAGVCTTSGSYGATVTLLAIGTCTIQATQAGNAVWAPATASQSFAVEQPQTITFRPLANRLFGSAPFTVSATATSRLPVSFNSQNTTVCTTSGTNGATVTLVAAGICTIQATQAGNAKWAPAPPENQSFLVQLTQTISFAPLPNQNLDARPFKISATASSGLAVTFTSETTAVCAVDRSRVTLLAVGTCTIQASQAGDGYYAAATPVDQSFQVLP